MPVLTSIHDRVAVLRLELGRGNAINDAFLEAVSAAFGEAERSDARAVVVTGQGRAFCAGLDLVEATARDRDGLDRFVEGFERFFLQAFRFEKPLVAAINGHAIAGGCILAMACDVRVMADGPYRIGINEVELGIPFPSAAFEIARLALPERAWAEGFLEGRRWTPAEAHAHGLVHELAPDGAAVEAAIARAGLLADRPASAARQIKAYLRAETIARIEAGWEAKRGRFIDHWFGPEAKAAMARVIGELGRKKGAGS